MREGRRSMTAEGVAMRRAAHQIYDCPLLFMDPFALKILGTDSAARVQNLTQLEISHPWERALRLSIAMRSRVAEDELAKAVVSGVSQYVILGAGLDTFAYRNPYPHVQVFEVDFPDTQTWKCSRLEDAAILVPPSVRYVPIDFERQSLSEELKNAGFCQAEPAFFACLGVMEYLTREAATATLRYVAGMPERSGIVFDYLISPTSMTSQDRSAFDFIIGRRASAGEPFRLAFDPSQLAVELRTLGFSRIADLDWAAIRSAVGSEPQQMPEAKSGAWHVMSAIK